MTMKCNRCSEEWSNAVAWMLMYVCPKCGSTDVTEIKEQYLPIGVDTKVIDKNHSLYGWFIRSQKHIKKET